MFPYELYSSLIKPVMFMASAETAHNFTLKMAQILQKKPLKGFFEQKVQYRPVEVMGLKFSNPLGLAAGMDKNGDAVDFFGGLGFGHIELGTVTPKPQPGNARPRLFRVTAARGLINRMGFNNNGVEYLVNNLRKRTYKGVVGVSVGKNESTPLEDAWKDYVFCYEKVYPYADYVAVNISCPNTQDLTQLQQEDEFLKLIKPLKERQDQLSNEFSKYVPLVVKLSPDLFDSEIEALCNVCLAEKVDGITCTNTTVSRTIIHGMVHANEWGGMSGEPLYMHSTRILSKVNTIVKGSIPLIGVGGVSGPISAREKLYNGASLIQVLTGFVYQGPTIVKQIVNNL